MNLIFSSPWAVAYAVAVIVSTVLIWHGRSGPARRVIALVVLHWVSWRLLCTIAHHTAWPWLIHDAAMIAGLVIYGRCQLAYAAAAAYLLAFGFDQWWFIFGAQPEATAAVLEGVGYLTMIMATGAAHGPRTGYGNGPWRGLRHLFASVDFEPGRSFERLAGMSRKSVGVTVRPISQNRGA